MDEESLEVVWCGAASDPQPDFVTFGQVEARYPMSRSANSCFLVPSAVLDCSVLSTHLDGGFRFNDFRSVTVEQFVSDLRRQRGEVVKRQVDPLTRKSVDDPWMTDPVAKVRVRGHNARYEPGRGCHVQLVCHLAIVGCDDLH